MLRLSTARRVADAFWPDFVERDGVIFLPHVRPPVAPPGGHATLTAYERFHGHTHVQELFRWEPATVYDPELELDRPDPADPGHAVAWELAQRIAHMWLAKLAADFPAYRFRVYASRLDDPIVHFHRVREGEPPWMSDEAAAAQVARGELVLLDSGPATVGVAAT